MGQSTRFLAILASSAMMAVPATLTSDAAAVSQLGASSYCLAASTFANPRTLGQATTFAYDIGYDAVLIQDAEGVGSPQLCLFDRRSLTAHIEPLETTVPLPRPQTGLLMTAHRIGPITPTLPFELEPIQALLPDYTVMTVTAFAEGEPYETLQVFDGYERLMIIDEYLDVTIESPRIQNGLGANVGTTFADFNPQLTLDNCFMGAEAWTGSLVCWAPNAEGVRYRFDKRPWEAIYTGMPPVSTVAEWQLVEIIWEGSSPTR